MLTYPIIPVAPPSALPTRLSPEPSMAEDCVGLTEQAPPWDPGIWVLTELSVSSLCVYMFHRSKGGYWSL